MLADIIIIFGTIIIFLKALNGVIQNQSEQTWTMQRDSQSKARI